LDGIERRAIGLAKIVWKIEVQTRTRIESGKFEDGEISTEYTQWKMVERAPAPDEPKQ